jgi:hypothetical protein
MSVTENGSQLPGDQLSPERAPDGSALPGSALPSPAGAAIPGTAGAVLGMDSLREPVFPPAAWLDETGLAEHPLLRGLLLELPPKGSTPSPEWLNRWFEAARAILELLYVRS